MNAVADSTVLVHLPGHEDKMLKIIDTFRITDLIITRINYLEILAGASDNAKLNVRKFLRPFKVIEFDEKACSVANKLAMKHPIDKLSSKDFLIAATCIAHGYPLITENEKILVNTQKTGLSFLPITFPPGVK